MDMGLGGKVALITGGSDGIGKAAALSLSREGVKVVICARRLDALESAAQEIRAELVDIDGFLDRRPAVVHLHDTGAQGLEGFLPPSKGVGQDQTHRSRILSKRGAVRTITWRRSDF